jgi:hypothetical protein
MEFAELKPWMELRQRLAGYFAARAHGLLALEFALSSLSGEEFGRLQVHGPGGAEFKTVSMRAKIERNAPFRYRILTDAAETLVANPARSTSGALELKCADRTYDARLDLLRNTAVARSFGGGEAARIAGGLTNRRYEAVFDVGDEGSLPVAVFLLYHAVALRRRAFLAGAKGGEASNS